MPNVRLISLLAPTFIESNAMVPQGAKAKAEAGAYYTVPHTQSDPEYRVSFLCPYPFVPCNASFCRRMLPPPARPRAFATGARRAGQERRAGCELGSLPPCLLVPLQPGSRHRLPPSPRRAARSPGSPPNGRAPGLWPLPPCPPPAAAGPRGLTPRRRQGPHPAPRAPS